MKAAPGAPLMSADFCFLLGPLLKKACSATLASVRHEHEDQWSNG